MHSELIGLPIELYVEKSARLSLVGMLKVTQSDFARLNLIGMLKVSQS